MASKNIVLMRFQRPSLPIVTLFAKRLPVILVPEQRLISTVRLDMIDHGCRRQFSRPFTLDAKRVVCQESLPRPLPAMVVASFKRAAPVAGVKRSVKLAILTAGQTRTAGMFAGFLGLHWHFFNSLSEKKVQIAR